MSHPSDPAQPETIIDARYRVVRLLGEGGFGQVFECRHVGTRRPFAVKLLLPEIARRPAVLSRFLREAQTAGCIKSPNVVDVIDVGQCRTTNAPFIAMELLAGEDLAQQLEARGPLAPEPALRVAAQALAGLAAAHAEGVVHRDIKPPNLFLARTGASQRTVKVLDFGIAKVLGEDTLERAKLTMTGSILGSPWYMSPEQAGGSTEIDQRSDLWSLGAVLYEALSGVTPYHGVTSLQQLLRQICDGPPKPLTDHAPHVPHPLAAIVTKAMAHSPAERYQSADEMLVAITRLLDGAPTITDAMLGVTTPPVPAPADTSAPFAALATSQPRHTQPMPSAHASATHGGLGRTVGSPPRRAYVLGGVAALVSVTLAALALLFIPKPGGEPHESPPAGPGTSAADGGTAAADAPDSGTAAADAHTDPQRAVQPLAPDPRTTIGRDAGAPDDAGTEPDPGRPTPARPDPRKAAPSPSPRPNDSFNKGQKGI